MRIPLPYLPAGIKEGLYDMEALAGYLLYRLTVLNPICKLSLKGIPEDRTKTHLILCLSGFVNVLMFILFSFDTVVHSTGVLTPAASRNSADQ
jgi:hypothetical protein